MAREKDPFGSLLPLREITRGGKKYVYSGDIPNTPNARKNAHDYGKEQGRKTVLVTRTDNKSRAYHYISKKFYPSLCNTLYPAFGKEDL